MSGVVDFPERILVSRVRRKSKQAHNYGLGFQSIVFMGLD